MQFGPGGEQKKWTKIKSFYPPYEDKKGIILNVELERQIGG